MAKHSVSEELRGILAFVGVVWIVFLVDLLTPLSLNQWGLVPRTGGGLIGVVSMTFLHAGFGHLISNTCPLVILLGLLAGSRTNSATVVISIVGVGGSLLWIFGRSQTHVGASLLIYGLIVFLIASGFLEKRIVSLVIALLVAFLYGGTLLWGILPSLRSHISWEGHLLGALAGGLVAWGFQNNAAEAPES